MVREGNEPPGPADDGFAVYQGLRGQMLGLDPAEAGLPPGPDRPVLWGAVMDMGFPSGTATLAVLAGGTTSLYTSTGGGIIGGGFHQAVADASRAFLACVAAHLGELLPGQDEALPRQGRVVIRAFTYQGRLAAEAAEDDLGYRRHPLSPVFHAGHAVLTQLRLIDEARGATR